ncbi:SCO6880 family protein [Pseudofrankia sp. DC12]|uniref:SCO6880 family protein n=1 Tax=Pseudofrankia sp. DC12 TaxID=683315 RepID=UPI0005F7C08A|nr:SCO6880 family protein [Pseudofrankia sp. DC12]
MSDGPIYRLPPQRAGTGFYGLTVAQLALAGSGVTLLAVAALTVRGQAGLLLGATGMVGSVLLAVVRIDGEPLHQLLPLLARYALTHCRPRRPTRSDRPPASPHGRACRQRHRPSLATSPAAGGTGWPQDGRLAGVDLRDVELLDGPRGLLPTSGDGPPVVIRHRAGGAVTVVLEVRGGPFTLLDAGDQHRALAAWSRVLAQTARTPGVVAFGWTLHTQETHPNRLQPTRPVTHPRGAEPRARSAPTRARADTTGNHPAAQPAGRLPPAARPTRTPTDAAPSAGGAAAVASYTRLLAATQLQQHDLRLWITIDPRRGQRRAGHSGRPEQVGFEAAASLAARAADAGLTIHGALTAAQLTADLTRQTDPAPFRRPQNPREPVGLAARAGLPGALTTAPAAGHDRRRVRWDAVQTGETWHRVFSVATWPTGPLAPGWLDPLLHETPGARTLTVAFAPLSTRASRRRLNHDTAAVDLALQIRDRHAVRVPDHLARAHDDIRQRDAEITAGHPELAYLALLDLTAPDHHTLDAATGELADLAARAGITDLRPLHGRHHHALPAVLPLGLTIRPAHPGAER